MKPAGLAAFEKRDENRSGIYAYENAPVPLSAEFEKRFKANKKAWEYFESEAIGIRKQASRWVMSAKQEETKIADSKNFSPKAKPGERFKPNTGSADGSSAKIAKAI